MIDYSGAVGSIYYGTADGITNPIVPLAPGCNATNATSGYNGADPNHPALNAACFDVPLITPSLANGVPSNDPFETHFQEGQRNIFRQAWQKRADISLVKETKVTERVLAKFSIDIYNVTNTPSFDIPIDNVQQNFFFTPTPSTAQTALPTCNAAGQNSNPDSFYSCPAGLGITTKTIGSSRQVQMSLAVRF